MIIESYLNRESNFQNVELLGLSQEKVFFKKVTLLGEKMNL